MRTRVMALALALAGPAAACSESGPSSRAVDDPSVTTAPPTLVTTPTSATVVIITTPPGATTVPPTTPPPATVATTATTAPAGPVEDLAEGDHVGIVAAINGTVISFDRVDAVDGNGDGTVDAYTNTNPRVRAVPIPDNVLIDGQVLPAANAVQQLRGLTTLVRLTVVGQRLASVEKLSVPV